MRRETAERITAEINSINALGTIDESDVDEAFLSLKRKPTKTTRNDLSTVSEVSQFTHQARL